MANFDAPKFKEFVAAYERGDTTADMGAAVFPNMRPSSRSVYVRLVSAALVSCGVLTRRKNAVSDAERKRRAEQARELGKKFGGGAFTPEARAKGLAVRRANAAAYRAWKASQPQAPAAE